MPASALRHIERELERFCAHHHRHPSFELGDRFMVRDLDFAHTLFRELYQNMPDSGDVFTMRAGFEEYMDPDRPLHFFKSRECNVLGFLIEIDMDTLEDAYREEKFPVALDPETAAAVDRGRRLILDRDGKPLKRNGGRI